MGLGLSGSVSFNKAAVEVLLRFLKLDSSRTTLGHLKVEFYRGIGAV
jgi:hypothetical protein